IIAALRDSPGTEVRPSRRLRVPAFDEPGAADKARCQLALALLWRLQQEGDARRRVCDRGVCDRAFCACALLLRADDKAAPRRRASPASYLFASGGVRSIASDILKWRGGSPKPVALLQGEVDQTAEAEPYRFAR